MTEAMIVSITYIFATVGLVAAVSVFSWLVRKGKPQ